MPRIITGRVTSDKMSKSIVISLTERRTHPLYKKQYTVNTKFMAHDEDEKAKVGDLVGIIESRPLSAKKRFTLHEIVAKAGAGFEEKDAVADVPEEEIMTKAKPEKPVAKEAPAEPKVAKEEAK